MKSKISLFNKAVFKRNLTGGWCLWSAILLFYLLTLPVSMYGTLSDLIRYETNIDGTLQETLKLSMISTIWGALEAYVPLFALAALLCAMFVFSYLFTGRNSNMMHTFPINRITLFATNYVTGLLFLMIPVTLSAVLTLGVGAVYGVLDALVVKHYLIWIVTVAVENIFFFSMAVCVLMFVGNMIAVPVMYLILNFLYDGCVLIVETMLSIVCYGLESYTFSSGMFGVLTPILYLARRVGGNSRIELDGKFEEAFRNMHVLPGYFVAAVFFVVIAIVVYEKKHIETADDVITVKWLKPIFRWGASVCTSALVALLLSSMFYTKSFWVILSIVIVTGLIVFFIAQMLLERSVHIFTKRKIQEGMIYTIIVCAFYVALDMDVAGLEKKVPSMDDIQAAKISGQLEMLSDDDEEIAFIHDIHRQIVDSRKEFKRSAQNYSRNSEYVSIDYLLKDNSILKRVYEIPCSDDDGSVSKQIWDYAQKPEIILKQFFGIHYPEIDVYGGTWKTYQSDGSVSQEIRITETDAKQLYEAVVSDVNNRQMNPGYRTENVIEYTRGAVATAKYEDDEVKDIGHLTLDVRDEAGYLSVLDVRSILRYKDDNAKDGKAFVSVDERDTCTIEKLQELGFMKKNPDSESKG